MILNDMPCRQDCKNRSATCKFDGSCSLYTDWKAHRTEILTAYYDNKRLDKQAEHYRTDQSIKAFKKNVRKKK